MTIYGGEGNDFILGSAQGDEIFGGPGDDILNGRTGDDLLFGGTGEDILVGGDGDDMLYGNAGRDGLFGDAGNDLLFGGDDDDQLAGWEGNDESYGEAGNDVLIASPGIDNLYGGLGDDLYVFPRRDEQSLDDDTLFENPSEGDDSIYLPPEASTVAINSSSAVPQSIGPNSRLTLNGGGGNFENYWTEEAPDEPDQFDISATSDTQIDLAWQPTGDLSGYRIERLESGGDWQIIFEVPPNTSNVSTYSDTAVSSGTTYDYRITRETLLGGFSEYSYQRATAEEIVIPITDGPITVGNFEIEATPESVQVISGIIDWWLNDQAMAPSLESALLDDNFITTGVGHYYEETSLPVIEFTFAEDDLKNGPGADLVIFGADSSPGAYRVTVDYNNFTVSTSVGVVASAQAGSTQYYGWFDNSRLVEFGFAFDPGPYSSPTYDVLAGTLDLTNLGVPLGASVTKVRLEMYSSADLLGIGALEQPKILEIVVQTFIPLQGTVQNPIPTVESFFGFFATDPRFGIDATPGVADNDYRTRLHVVIDTDDSTIISMTTDAGPTTEYRDEDATMFVNMAEAQEGKGMIHNAQVNQIFDDATFIRLNGRAKNPLVTPYQQCPRINPCGGYFEQLGDLMTVLPAIVNPSIDFDFLMTFDPQEEELKVFEISNHEGFPSYEIFARYNGGAWQNVYFWDSNKENQTPWSLFGSGEISVGDIDPTDLSS